MGAWMILGQDSGEDSKRKRGKIACLLLSGYVLQCPQLASLHDSGDKK